VAAPITPRVVEWFLAVEADDHRRNALNNGQALLEQAIRDGLIEQSEHDKNALARTLVQLAHRDAVDFSYDGYRAEHLLPDEADAYRLSRCLDFGSRPGARAMLPAVPRQSITVQGNVGQLAGRDINNYLAQLVQEAERQLDAADVPDAEREAVRSRLRSFGRAIASTGEDAIHSVAAEALLRLSGLK
jgi:hypothetical protein